MTRRTAIGLLLLVATALTIVASGCGGGGSVQTVPPVNDQLFTPNYISSLQGLYHWNHLPVRVAFVLPSDWNSLYGASRGLYVEAANEWNRQGQQALVAVVEPTAPYDAIVTFVSRADLSGVGNIQGLTDYTFYLSSSQMQSARIRVALDAIGGALLPATDAKETIAHEIGHALGIGGHSPNPTDLMFATHPYGSNIPVGLRDMNTAMTAYAGYFGRSPGRQPTGPAHTPDEPLCSGQID